MNERPIDPITLKLSTGQERKFLLSMGGLKRAKAKCGTATLKEMLEKDASEVAVPLLFEALLDKGDMTEDQFAELLPSDLPKIGMAVTALLGASMPQPKPDDRPINPSPTVQ